MRFTKVFRYVRWRDLFRLREAKRFGGETLIRGCFATPSLIALINVGFFEALVRERTVDIGSFAAENDLDLNVLKALCDYFYSLQILNKEGSYFVLGSRGHLVVELLQGSLYSAAAYAAVFHNIEKLLTGQIAYGVDLRRDPALAARGSGEMGKLLFFPMIADLVRENGYTRVLDLGCGDATFLIDLCKRNAAVHGYGIDISPEAIEDGRRKAAEEGFQDRVQLFAADMFNLRALKDQLDGVEIATTFFVLHEFLGGESKRVLDFFKMFKETFSHASLIICESIRHTPEQLRKHPGPILEFQLVHDLTGQRPITREEWKVLFREAGFATIEEQYLSFARVAIYRVC